MRNPKDWSANAAWESNTWKALGSELSSFGGQVLGRIITPLPDGKEGDLLVQRFGARPVNSHIIWALRIDGKHLGRGEFYLAKDLMTRGDDDQVVGHTPFHGWQESAALFDASCRGKGYYPVVLLALRELLQAPLAGDYRQSQGAQRAWSKVGKLDAGTDLWIIA